MRFLIVISLCFACLLGGCQNEKLQGANLSDPRGVVQAYYQALFKGDMDAAYNLIWERDRWFLLNDDFRARHKLNAFAYPLYVAHKYGYQFKSLVQAEDAAMVSAVITMPNLGELNAALGERLLDAALPPINDAELKNMVEQRNWQFAKQEVFHDLRYDEGRWYIYFNLESKEKEAQLVRKGNSLMASAKLGDLSDARERFAEALALNPQSQAAQTGLALSEAKINLMETKLGYIREKLELFDFAAITAANNKNETAKPGVTFKLRNNGNKALSRVWVRVTFFSAKGKIVSREVFEVLDFAGANGKKGLLLPGEVWEFAETGFYTSVLNGADWHENWQPGSAKAEVRDISFADEIVETD